MIAQVKHRENHFKVYMVPSEQINRNHVKYTQVYTHLGYFSDVIHGPLYAMLTFATMTFYV